MPIRDSALRLKIKGARRYLSAFVYLLLILFSTPIFAQTVQYRRVKIVTNGIQQSVNDDAHYLTFSSNGFYESDANGYSVGNSKMIEFVKDDIGLHCYSGPGFYGYGNYFFSSDYSRINLKLTNNTVYVYEKITGTTTASNRAYVSTNSDGVSTTPVVTTPYTPIPSHERHPRREKCTFCNGTGIGANLIKYHHNYDGTTTYEYCSECGTTRPKHHHEKHPCGKCEGRGYVERIY